ncbi:cysteine methyltransferase [Salinimonas sp. HHU 13199]|uniref:Cysteine methyltransferase n=1 Tax=Salinimonas profundi TaxID=2729140 RepID=A0ABR8LJN4_9ALTE|nr:MGMT family protein [Salinimonas profundi]MBD3585788.1 cysteine methyltransferase [Salinimonas profundi]
MPQRSGHQQIYHVVSLIPSGCVATYGQVADLAGLPGRARLVGRLLRTAPSHLNLPWHRVVRANGQIAVDGNSAVTQQNKLLAEGVVVTAKRVNIKRFLWQPTLYLLLHELSG